jgi:hypothetical protein
LNGDTSISLESEKTFASREYAETETLYDELHKLSTRIRQGTLTLQEMRHLVDENIILFKAMKGKYRGWKSVIDVSILILQKDMSANDLYHSLPYSKSILYRAIRKLESIKFLVPNGTNGSEKIWTINSEKFPILYMASRG